MRRLLPLAALATLTAGALVAPAAANQDVLTFLHIKRSFPTFHGTIDSREKGCVKGRTVKLLQKRKHADDKVLGRDEAKADGRWKVKVVAGSGSYYAKAPRLESHSRDLACKAAVSRALIVD
jgi:hypothetical protein